MEVFSINQISQGKHMARKIIPHKEMPRAHTTIQAGMPGDLPNKRAGIPGPAKPAQAWEKIPTNQEPVFRSNRRQRLAQRLSNEQQFSK